MPLITVTTVKAVQIAIGAAIDPGDGITDTDYQRTQIASTWKKHQNWVNYVRNDKTKLLSNLYRNIALYNIILIYSSAALSDNFQDTVDSLATLMSERNALISGLIAADQYFGNIVEKSLIESELTDGGYFASDNVNPKAVTVIALRAQFYTRN